MASADFALPARHAAGAATDRTAAVRRWLWFVALLVVAMVVVGGATRLTGSGLSITEWRPVTGAIPPLGAADWAAEFERYRASPQYQLVNQGMSLGEFQFIYWWEWGHRQLGRLIGIVYLAGFLWAWLSRRVDGRRAALLFGMGLLLGLQGAVGWIMVASGLQPGMTAVAPVKLTLHLVFACLFLASLVAMATALAPTAAEAPPRLRRQALVLLVLLLVQIALGGLVAGSKAGLTFNTWPLMDGSVVPGLDTLFAVTPWHENFIDNAALVQWNHRLGAYLLLAFAGWHAAGAAKAAPASPLAGRALALAVLVLAQAAIGVATLLLAVPLWAGLLHQAAAMVVLVFAVSHVTRLWSGAGRVARA